MTMTMPPPTSNATGAQSPSGALPMHVSMQENMGDSPRRIQRWTLDEVASLVGSFLAGVALTYVIYEDILAWSGSVGFIICCWIAIVTLYATVSMFANPLPIVKDRLAGIVALSVTSIPILVVGDIVIHVVSKGAPALGHWNFYVHDMSGVRPTAALDQGGIFHALVGTAIEVGIAVAIALPLGIGTAVYMSEVGGRTAVYVRTVVEAMTALPDIIAGLFVYALLVVGFGMPKSGFSAALALTVTMVPVVARSCEVVLRVVPSGLREASLALGSSQWQTVRRVVLPTARPGLATSLILGIARISGETAPLLIVSGQNTYLNKNPFDETMNSLPLFAFQAVRTLQPVPVQRAYGAASVLLFVVVVLFVFARFLSRDKTKRR